MADGALHFVVTQDNKQMLASLEQMRQGFSRMSQQAQQSGNELDQTLNRLKSTLVGVAGGVASVATLKELGKQVMNVRGEFQQLEIAFGTMLGDGEKANKLMSQLINTAAKTPFDLKGIAQGAKQLLAYGISADDVNDTLVRLGDIAAGLSVPLNDLVYLYGTTMVQGRMFTQDLRQFQGRGVPLMEALADTMGVAKDEVSDLVSTGKVGAAEFQKAILSLTDEGSKFGGLMNKQSKSITGQIGNIQDGIDMMFNEIGQKSEGFINKALSGVSNLVENYEKVGKAVLAVAGTYGTYRAALVVVSAVEKAHTAMLKAAVLEKTLAAGANITLSNSDAMAAARKAFFTKTIKLNTQALLKNTAAMLTNPAVLVTAGLVALCASVYAVSKALNTQARAQEQVNKLNTQNKEYLDQVKSDADQAIATIQSETATIYEKAKAYRTLQSIMPALTKQFSQDEIATMKLADAQKNVAATIEDMEFAQKANEITKSEKAISDYEQQLSELSKNPKSGASMMIISNKLDTECKVLKQLKKEYQDMLQLRKQALFDAQPVDVKIAKFTTDKETLQKQLDDIQARADEAVAKAKEEWENNPLNKWRIDLGVTFEQAASESPSLLGGEYNLLQPIIKGLQNSIQETDNQIQSLSASTTTQTKQILEEVNEETLKAENERQRILNSSIQAERVKREAAYWQTIREINQEEAAYRKANEGRTSKEFKIKRNNAELQLIIDTEALDRQFAEWKRNIEQETINLQYDFETSELERAINLEQDWNEKLAKQEALRNKIIEQIEEEARQTKETELGAHTDPQLYSTFLAYNAKGSTDEDKSNAISEYINTMSAKGIKVNTDSLITTLQEMSEKVVLIDQQTAAKIKQAEQQHNTEMLEQDIDDYIAYCEEMLQAARKREQALAAIESGEETNRTKEMVEADYEADVRRSSKDHSIDAAEKEATDIVARLIGSLADVTYDQVDEATKQFFDALDQQMQMLEQVRGMSQEDKNAAAEQTQADIAQLTLEQENPLLNDEQKLAIQEQINEKEQQLVYLKMTELQMDGQLNKLLQTRRTMEDAVATTKQSAGAKSVKQMQQEQRTTARVTEALQAVSDAADAVADTFGGALSQKAKKALGVVSDIADFGITAIDSISSVVSGTSQAMTATAGTASTALSTLEKASLILTIISVAVQLAMKIVNIAKQFTASAKMQEAIDAQKENVEKLQRQLEKFHRSYKDTSGTEYYRKLAEEAKKYTWTINAQKKAVNDAHQLYLHNLGEYGEDSDKTKEAKKQYEELQDEQWEYEDSQKELYDQLMEDLSGTNLKTFSESLADALIEGFENGKEGIDDVWEDTMDDLMRTMMKQQLALAIQDMFDDTFKKLNSMTKEGGDLTQSEIDQILNEFEAKSAQAKYLAEKYYDLMSERGLLDDADTEGSEGFGQMTQDTADALNARFTALQIEGANVVEAAQSLVVAVTELGADSKLNVASLQTLMYNSNIALQVAQEQLDQLQVIADNTALLADTNDRLKAIQQNTARL